MCTVVTERFVTAPQGRQTPSADRLRELEGAPGPQDPAPALTAPVPGAVISNRACSLLPHVAAASAPRACRAACFGDERVLRAAALNDLGDAQLLYNAPPLTINPKRLGPRRPVCPKNRYGSVRAHTTRL